MHFVTLLHFVLQQNMKLLFLQYLLLPLTVTISNVIIYLFNKSTMPATNSIEQI